MNATYVRLSCGTSELRREPKLGKSATDEPSLGKSLFFLQS